MKNSGMNGFGNDGKVPEQILEKSEQTRGVISWGDREYDVDEFRSLLMIKTGDSMEAVRDGTE